MYGRCRISAVIYGSVSYIDGDIWQEEEAAPEEENVEVVVMDSDGRERYTWLATYIDGDRDGRCRILAAMYGRVVYWR